MVVLLGLAAVGGVAAWSFVQAHSEDKHDDDAEKPIKVAPRVSNADGVPTITLDQEAASRSDIATVTLTNRMQAKSLRAYGTVLDLQSLTDLASRYASAKADMATQEAKRDLSRANVARARALYEQGPQAISKAQLETAEETYQIDAASLAAAHAQLATLANRAIQAWGDVLGKAVTEDSTLLTDLVERRTVLIQVTLPPDEILRREDLASKAAEDAFIETAGKGRIALRFVSPAAATDPHIQGQSFFYMAGADSGLMPGMNVMAFVSTGETVNRAKVPAAAVVWLQGRAWAYVRTGPKTLVRREIATDWPAPDGGYFVKDMPDGTQIVVRGAQMLLSEEFRAQIQTEE